MKNIVPNFNKTQLKRALETHPPGSFYGFIDWKNIVVQKIRDSDGWMEAYIPFKFSSDSYIRTHELESMFNTIERVWGEISTVTGGSKGFINHKGKNCFYVCFKPNVSGEVRR